MRKLDYTAARVLADPALTRQVVLAAAEALSILEGPERTADGDAAAMVARNRLLMAFTNWDALGEVLSDAGLRPKLR